jgi:hypothetical protein
MALGGLLVVETAGDALLVAEAAGVRAGLDWRRYVWAEARADRREREAGARKVLALAQLAEGPARERLIAQAEALRARRSTKG